MKRIKAMNGYTIYLANERDEKKNPQYHSGEYYIFFSSDIRDYGLTYSDFEYEVETLEIAEGLCMGSNYAVARELVEDTTTAASYAEVAEVERMLDNGLTAEEVSMILELDEMEEDETEPEEETAPTYWRCSYEFKGHDMTAYYYNQEEAAEAVEAMEQRYAEGDCEWFVMTEVREVSPHVDEVKHIAAKGI